MENKEDILHGESNNKGVDRRKLIGDGIKLATIGSIVGVGLLSGCRGGGIGEEKEVSPPEDLMQEHGVLRRILLIYDTCRLHLINKESFPLAAIANSASIIRSFVEDYHEKQEEEYLFPRFKKAGQLTDLVDVLLLQHQAGRKMTDQMLQISGLSNRTDGENERLIQLLHLFTAMYHPHAAREDTVLFPAFRKMVSQNEYDRLGDEFEKNEHKLFGEDGFAAMVDKVAVVEKTLGIYELSQFTPGL